MTIETVGIGASLDDGRRAGLPIHRSFDLIVENA
jgi:hypothetical protein